MSSRVRLRWAARAGRARSVWRRRERRFRPIPRRRGRMGWVGRPSGRNNGPGAHDLGIGVVFGLREPGRSPVGEAGRGQEDRLAHLGASDQPPQPPEQLRRVGGPDRLVGGVVASRARVGRAQVAAPVPQLVEGEQGGAEREEGARIEVEFTRGRSGRHNGASRSGFESRRMPSQDGSCGDAAASKASAIPPTPSINPGCESQRTEPPASGYLVSEAGDPVSGLSECERLVEPEPGCVAQCGVADCLIKPVEQVPHAGRPVAEAGIAHARRQPRASGGPLRQRQRRVGPIGPARRGCRRHPHGRHAQVALTPRDSRWRRRHRPGRTGRARSGTAGPRGIAASCA